MPMRKTIAMLEAAQKPLLRDSTNPAERQALLARLNEHVPAPLLAHFLRLVDQGRPGVAWVRNGVCSVCHIRVASATTAILVKPDDVHVCEHCGSYLLLAPDAIPQPAPVTHPRARRQRRNPEPVTA